MVQVCGKDFHASQGALEGDPNETLQKEATSLPLLFSAPQGAQKARATTATPHRGSAAPPLLPPPRWRPTFAPTRLVRAHAPFRPRKGLPATYEGGSPGAQGQAQPAEVRGHPCPPRVPARLLLGGAREPGRASRPKLQKVYSRTPLAGRSARWPTVQCVFDFSWDDLGDARRAAAAGLG